MKFRGILFILLLVISIPLCAFGWGGRTHISINRIATMMAPDEMEGWDAYADILANGGYVPDLWKGDDPDESPRHYIDIESYEGVNIKDFPRDFDQIKQMGKVRADHINGIAPWIILELQKRLTGAMASNDWPQAAAVAAAMGHYVGDTHQPLHTTENYDGITPISKGVHLRWEVTMPTHYMKKGLLRPTRKTEYLPDVWPVILDWIDTAHSKYMDILEADDEAFAAANGNVESTIYYDVLWDRSGKIFLDQVIASEEHLSDMWYTAWVDAGRPKIPPPPETIPQTSIWTRKSVRQTSSSWPFLVAFAIIGVVVIALSYRRRRA